MLVIIEFLCTQKFIFSPHNSMCMIHRTAIGVIYVSSFKLIYRMVKPFSIMTFSNQQNANKIFQWAVNYFAA